jgi:hypothetical protein
VAENLKKSRAKRVENTCKAETGYMLLLQHPANTDILTEFKVFLNFSWDFFFDPCVI